MTICHLCSASPEWAPGALDPEYLGLPLLLVEPLAPPVVESERKPLWLKALMGSKLAGKQVPISALVPNLIPGVSRMARPPFSTRRAKRV